MPTPAERAAKRLAWEMESWKAIELETRSRLEAVGAGPGMPVTFDENRERYVETSEGQRFGEEESYAKGKLMARASHYGDSKRFAEVLYDAKDLQRQLAVTINRHYAMEDRGDFAKRPTPLAYFYVGREPLHKALARAENLGTSKVLGRDCDVFLFRGIRWPGGPQDQVFHLDVETAIPLKVEGFANETARRDGKPYWTWTAESLDREGPHPLPRKSTNVSYIDGRPVLTSKFTVESVAFDKAYPASTFWPAVQPGVRIFDTIERKSSVAPGERAPRPVEGRTTSQSPVPIEAEPPTDHTGAIVFGVGLVLLIAGLVAWRRMR